MLIFGFWDVSGLSMKYIMRTRKVLVFFLSNEQ